MGRTPRNVTDHIAVDGSNTVDITADIHDMSGLQALGPRPRPGRWAVAAEGPPAPTLMALAEQAGADLLGGR